MPPRLGRYVLLEQIGHGGMGVVWTAYDPKLDRKVAIKLLRQSARTGTRQARFIREAQALARLSHPNIVTVHDVDTHDGQLFMAMEYVEGQTLEVWTCARSRGWRQIVDVLVEAGQGLAAAHAAGITHRDFKPSNVLIARDGRVKVLDFGLAKHGDHRASHESDDRTRGPVLDEDGSNLMELIGTSVRAKLTGVGRLVGTPAYMAPEQFRIDDQPIGPWTDQFGFGVTLYEALYGVLPFLGQDLYETYQNIQTGRMCEPDPKGPVPGWVFAVLVRALQYEYTRRFRSMEALLEALKADPARLRRRRLTLTAMVGLVGLAGYGLVQAVTREPPRPCQGAGERLAEVWNPQAREAVKQGLVATERPFAADTAQRVTGSLDRYAEDWVQQHTAICEATRVHGQQSETLLDVRMTCLDRRRGELGALVRVLADARDDTVAMAMAATAELRRPQRCASAQPGSDHDLPADPRQRAELLTLQGRVDEARALLSAGRILEARDRAAAVGRQASVAGLPQIRAAALILEGTARREANELGLAQQRLREGIGLAAEVGDVRTEFAGWNDLLYIAGVELDEPERAADWRFAAEGALRRAGSSPELQFRLALTTAGVWLAQDRLEDATRVGQEALELAQAQWGEGSFQVARALNNLGIVAAKQRRWIVAERRLRQSHRLEQNLLGPDHPDVARGGMNLANVLVQHAKEAGVPAEARAAYDEAEGLYAEVLVSRRRSEGPRSKDVARTLVNLGLAQLNQGKRDRARESYRRAVELLRVLPEAEDDLVDALASLAELERLEQHYPDARALYEEAVERLRGRHGEPSAKVAGMRLYLCRLLIDAGEHQSALTECAQALAAFEADPGPRSMAARLGAHRLMAQAHEHLGHPQQAARHRARAAALAPHEADPG